MPVLILAGTITAAAVSITAMTLTYRLSRRMTAARQLVEWCHTHRLVVEDGKWVRVNMTFAELADLHAIIAQNWSKNGVHRLGPQVRILPAQVRIVPVRNWKG